MNNNFTLDKIVEIVNPIVNSLNCELYHIEYVKEAGENYLRIYIDNEAGVTLDDCESVSRKVSEFLDVQDPIGEPYIFEVSSPGIDRTLFTDRHLEKYQGNKVKIKLIKPFNGKKLYEGLLNGFTNEFICIKTENEAVNIPRIKIKTVNLIGVL